MQREDEELMQLGAKIIRLNDELKLAEEEWETRTRALRSSKKQKSKPSTKKISIPEVSLRQGTQIRDMWEWMVKHSDQTFDVESLSKAFPKHELGAIGQNLRSLAVRYKALRKFGPGKYRIRSAPAVVDRQSDFARETVKLLQKHKTISSKQIQQHTGADTKRVANLMGRLISTGKVTRLAPGQFEYMNGHNSAQAN